MAYLFDGCLDQATDNNGNPISGALMYIYLAGTTTLTPSYTDETEAVQNTNPVIADSTGRWPPVYLNESIPARVKATNVIGSYTLYDVDYVAPPVPDSFQDLIDAVDEVVSSMYWGLFADWDNAPPAIPTDMVTIQSDGHNFQGEGIAWYIYDATVDATYVSANSRAAFLAADGRGFRLDPEQRLTIDMFGGRGDDNGTTGTDNLPALIAAVHYDPASTYISGAAAFHTHARRIHFGKGRYYFSDTFEEHIYYQLHGEASGARHSGARGGTVWVFPNNKTAIRTQGSNTTGITTSGVTLHNGVDCQIFGFAFEARAGGSDLTKHGIHLRQSAFIRDCSFTRIPGNAIHIRASAGFGGELEGNASNWQVENVTVESCGGYGLRVDGSDANAGFAIGFHTHDCGLGGILDTSGLGSNTYISPQLTGYCGTHRGRVHHGGRLYYLIDPTDGIGSTTTPGTNNTIWFDVGAGSVSVTFPAWSGAATYYLSLPFCIWGSSCRSVAIAVYVEGTGPCHISGPGLYIGGQGFWTSYSGGMSRILNGLTNAVYSATGMGGHVPYVPDNADLGSFYEASVAAGGGVILNHARGTEGGGTSSWQYRYSGKDMAYQFGQSGKMPYLITGTATDRKFGNTTGTVPRYFVVSGLGLSDESGGDGNTRKHLSGTAAPASGEWAQGDIVYNVAPAASGFIGWVCIADGSPGTWKTWGVISA